MGQKSDSISERSTGVEPILQSYNVVLRSCGDKKIYVIRIVREATGMGLKEAKDLVEGTPSVVKIALSRADAESLKSKLEGVGAHADVKDAISHDHRKRPRVASNSSRPRRRRESIKHLLQFPEFRIAAPPTPIEGSNNSKAEPDTPDTLKQSDDAPVPISDQAISVQLQSLGADECFYSVVLKFCRENKFAVIKFVRSVIGSGLREARDLVETAPCAIKKGLTIMEAKALQSQLEQIGAQAEITVEGVGDQPFESVSHEEEERTVQHEIFSAISARSYSRVKELLRGIPSLEFKDMKGQTPLLLAASLGCNEVVQLLHDAGASLDVTTPDGMCAWHWALNSHDHKLLHILQERRAKIPSELRTDINRLLKQLPPENSPSPMTQSGATSKSGVGIKGQQPMASTSNIERWKQSGDPERWVGQHPNGWNHQDWLNLLNSLRKSNYWPMEEAAVGRVVEEIRNRIKQPATNRQPSPAADEALGEVRTDCDELLALASPNLYRRNLFRILGMSVASSPAEVRRQQKRAEMQRKLGVSTSGGISGPLALTPAPSEEEIRGAVVKMNEPMARFLNELFWFWPTCEDDTADAALCAASAGDTKQAEELWTNQLREPSNRHAASHNLAVLAHLMALDAEVPGLSNGDKSRGAGLTGNEWGKVLSRWKDVIENEDIWNHLRRRVKEINDPHVLTTGLVRRIRQTLPKTLLLINAHLAREAAQKGNTTSAQIHVSAVKQAAFGNGLADAALRDAIEPVRDRIKALLESARKNWSSNPLQGATIVAGLLTEANKLLIVVDALLPQDDVVRIGLRDSVSETISDGAWAYARKTNNWNAALELVEKARAIASSQTQREKQDQEIINLKESGKSGNDWCSPEYWQLPPEVIEQLESIRVKAQSGDFENAIQALLSLDPKIGKPLRRCLAFCLSQRGQQITGQGLQKFNQPSSKIRAFLDYIQRHGTVKIPSPNMQRFMLPDCPCCGSSNYSSWSNGEYDGQRFWMCSSCSSVDDRERDERKKALSTFLTEALEYSLLADEIDPGDAGVQDNVKTLKELASKINCSIPKTKALRAKLGNTRQRGRRETLVPASGGSICHFCGNGSGDPDCQITFPMCGGSESAQMLLGKGIEYRFGDVVVPRCRRCREAHEDLTRRSSQWKAARLAVQEERNFPAIIEAMKTAERSLRQSQQDEQGVANSGKFPLLDTAIAGKFPVLASAVAAAASAAKALADAKAHFQLQAQAQTAAEADLRRAQSIGAKCEQCSTDEGLPSWGRLKGSLCPTCDRRVFKLGLLPKIAVATLTAISGYAAITLCRDMGILPVQEAAAMPAIVGISTYMVLKMFQWRSRRLLNRERANEIAARRRPFIAEAETKLDECRRNFENAKSQETSALNSDENARRQLQVAQEQAKADANRRTVSHQRELEEARHRLEAAKKNSAVAYDRTNPEPTLSRSIRAEADFRTFAMIAQMKKRGWIFGSEPVQGGGKASDEPTNVRGLVALSDGRPA